MQTTYSIDVNTDTGTLTLAHETYEDTGETVWTWRDGNGRLVATQSNVTEMVAWKRQHEVR